jgi:hypothetical protein
MRMDKVSPQLLCTRDRSISAVNIFSDAHLATAVWDGVSVLRRLHGGN